MLQRLVEIVVLLNALGAGAGFFYRRVRRQRRQAQLEYIRQLEAENKEIDQSIERMTTSENPPQQGGNSLHSRLYRK